jgi:hypothetical protein
MYVIYLRTGHRTTIEAASFTKTDDEVLFYEGDPKRQRNQKPNYEAAVAAFRHEEIAGFAHRDHVVDDPAT